jgi:hypothetical protein
MQPGGAGNSSEFARADLPVSLLSVAGNSDYNDTSGLRIRPVFDFKDASMRRIALRWAALLGVACTFLFTGPLSAQGTIAQRSREEDQIRNWYRDYLGREVGPELVAWVQYLRSGMSPLDVQAAILGSDEFYRQKGLDEQTFLIETLQSVTWEEPTISELRRWTDRLRILRGNRFEVAREILLAYDQPGGTATPAGPNQSEIAGRLSAAAKLLIDNLDFDIGGTQQGRQANLKAQALADAIEQYRRAAAVSVSRPTDASLALQNVERSLSSLQSTLNSPAGTAPSAAGIVRRISTMIVEAQSLGRPSGTRPLPGPNVPPASQPLLTQAESASRAVESIIQSFTSDTSSYLSGIILRDLDTFAARLDALETSIRANASRDRLQWEIEALNEQANRIGPQLLAGRPPAFTRLFWSSVESSLEQMADTLGISLGDSTDVLRPTPLAPDVLPLVDQALSRAEVFLTGTQPLVFGIPEVPRVQRDVKNLKSRLLTLRQEAQQGEPAARQIETLNSMVADYLDAFNRWNQIVSRERLQNPPRLSPVGETLNEVERLLKAAVAGEDLTPATGSVSSSRVTRLLGTMQNELTSVREALPVFVNYPEHRALLTYCDQLSDFLGSLNDLQHSTSAAPDAMRRQAAAMQGTVAFLSATGDALEARARGAGARAAQAAVELRNQTRRLALLADDLESELH